MPSGVVQAGPATLPKTPDGAFEVQDWVVFVCDPNQPQANSGSMFLSTLPDFVNGRRNPAPVEKAAEPGPIGVIRFTGNSGGDKVDVLLENKGGRFLGHWPKAQTRSTGLLWQNLIVADQPATGPQDPLGASSWINRLRTPPSPSLMRDGKGEKFLLYDAEPNYKLPLKVQAGTGDLQYQVVNNGTAALKDLTFYKKQADGWHTLAVAELSPATKPATQPATHPTKPPASVKKEADGSFSVTLTASSPASKPATLPSSMPATQPATAPITLASTEPATTKPSTRSTTQASSKPATQPAGFPVALVPTGLEDAPAVLEPWKQKLTSLGLASTDQDLIVSILEKHALDSNRLTAIYRLDADQLDQLFPLDVVPTPRKTTRVGLVIVRNIDPAIATEIDTLVAQLGDPKWDTRQLAYKRLLELGLAARPKLELLLHAARDPEIVYRMERLIAALAPKEPGQPATPSSIDP